MQAVLIVISAALMALTISFLIEKARNRKINKAQINMKSEFENMSSNDAAIDYEMYSMRRKEKLLYTSIAAFVVYIVGFIFYKSHIISILLTPLALVYPSIKKREIIKKRKNELLIQFKEALYALSTSLSAGKSIEIAFEEALKDLLILYPDTNTYIVREFQYIVRRLEMNEIIEDVLADFAKRAGLEEVSSFVDVFITCKRTGGNIVEIIKSTSNMIVDKIHIKQDIETILAQKKFEQKLLNIIPVFLILVLSSSAKDYMQPVFTTVLGRAMMTIAIVLLAVSYFISKKIMDIEV